MTTMTGSEWLLYRAFATVEVNCSKACWQKNIRTGYEVSRSYHPGHMSRDERLGSDGNRHRDLREQLDPFWFAVLEIRYGDNPEKIRQALKSIAPHFGQDKRLVKALRDNREKRQEWMLWVIRHQDLRQSLEQPRTTSERTTLRWQQNCMRIAEDWIYPAEDRAFRVLQERGELR